MEPRPLDTPGPFLDAARAVLTSGAWLYSAHTSLDANPSGPAGWLARNLGLANIAVLEPTAEGLGLGQVGALPAPLAWDAFTRALAANVRREFWTLAGTPPPYVERVAVCPGSGGSLAAAARAAGAQVLVTGDLKYHQALDAGHPATGLCVVDVGISPWKRKWPGSWPGPWPRYSPRPGWRCAFSRAGTRSRPCVPARNGTDERPHAAKKEEYP